MPRSCCECEAINPSYRCPTCYNFYCSVDCCQNHKKKTCSPISHVNDNVNDDPSFQFCTEDTVSPEKLKLLEQNTQLIDLLKNSYLRNIIKDINDHPNPNKAIKFYMQQPDFSKFVDVILELIEPEKNRASNSEIIGES